MTRCLPGGSDAHTIQVMNHGRIVEQGTHGALLAKPGFWFDFNLYDSQSAERLLEAG